MAAVPVEVPAVMMPVPAPPVPVCLVMAFRRGGLRRRHRGGRNRRWRYGAKHRVGHVLERELSPFGKLQLRPAELQLEAVGKVALARVGLGAPQLDGRFPIGDGA